MNNNYIILDLYICQLILINGIIIISIIIYINLILYKIYVRDNIYIKIHKVPIRKIYKKFKGFSKIDLKGKYKRLLITDLLYICIPNGQKKSFYMNCIGLRGINSGKFIIHNVYNNIYNNDLCILLTDYSKNIMRLDNAGGNSLISEILSLEIIRYLIEECFPKKNKNKMEEIITEKEIQYIFPDNSPKTDYIIKFGNKSIAVSTTRAMSFGKIIFTEEKAIKLIYGKIRRINESNENVLPPYNWDKQILHIITQKKEYSKMLEKVFNNLDSEYTKKILIICSVFESKLPYLRDEIICGGIYKDEGILQVPSKYL
jgi:hypothetical protein